MVYKAKNNYCKKQSIIFTVSLSVCAFQEKFLSICTPANLVPREDCFIGASSIIRSKAPVSQLVNADDTSVIEIKTQLYLES